MYRYALLNSSNTIIDFISYDGITEWVPPENHNAINVEHLIINTEDSYRPELGHIWNGTQFNVPPRNFPNEWIIIRSKRDELLTQSDLNILPDRFALMDSNTQQAWITYRQELRNLPDTYGANTGNTDLIVWPTKPN
jgi:hypothetical protein